MEGTQRASGTPRSLKRREESHKPGKVYKYDGASDTPAKGVADRAAWSS